MFNALLLGPSDPPNTSITRHRLLSGSCTRSHACRIDYCYTVLAGAPRTITDRFQRVLNVAVRVVSGTRKFDRGLSQLLHFKLHSESQYTGVCRIKLLSTRWTTERVHRTSQAANAFDRPTVTSWWVHDTIAARLVVGLSPSRVR